MSAKMDMTLDGKLFAAILHTITVLHFERLNTEQRAFLADAIVREIALRKILQERPHEIRDR